MRKIALVALLLAVCLPVFAGDVNVPPLPPPCTENCQQAVPLKDSVKVALARLIIRLI